MKEQSSKQKKKADSEKANQAFFKSEGSGNSFFSKTENSLSPLSFNANPIQKKSKEGLPGELQNKMENSLGHDFSNVKIQKNSQEAVQLNARAFTQGDAVHFAPNEFNPNSVKGKELIGHEFAHVVQQRNNVVKPTIQQKGQNINDNAKLEQEADAFGEKIARTNDPVNTTEKLATRATNANVIQRQIPEKSSDVTEVSLNAGSSYTVTADDMSQGNEEVVWNYLARNNGMRAEKLKLFNQHVQTVQLFGFTLYSYNEVVALSEGAVIYIPSADELAFLAFRENFPSYDNAVQEFGTFLNSSNQEVLRSARDRASGNVGESYGTESDTFYTPNRALAGASTRRSEMIDGQREYRINWGSDLWKCNVFMHDVVYDAGYVPHLSGNNHYITAGNLHTSNKYRKIKIGEVKPGSLVQLFGGTGSNASHNMVLSSFVDRTDNGNGTERWVFSAIGAEEDRSAESVRTFDINPNDSTGDFYEATSGGRDFIRFFEPKSER